MKLELGLQLSKYSLVSLTSVAWAVYRTAAWLPLVPCWTQYLPGWADKTECKQLGVGGDRVLLSPGLVVKRLFHGN